MSVVYDASKFKAVRDLIEQNGGLFVTAYAQGIDLNLIKNLNGGGYCLGLCVQWARQGLYDELSRKRVFAELTKKKAPSGVDDAKYRKRPQFVTKAKTPELHDQWKSGIKKRSSGGLAFSGLSEDYRKGELKLSGDAVSMQKCQHPRAMGSMDSHKDRLQRVYGLNREPVNLGMKGEGVRESFHLLNAVKRSGNTHFLFDLVSPRHTMALSCLPGRLRFFDPNLGDILFQGPSYEANFHDCFRFIRNKFEYGGVQILLAYTLA